MNIQELEDKHVKIAFEPLNFDEFHYKKHAKTSVEFAISALEELRLYVYAVDYEPIDSKIQELKQYLNE